MKIGSTDALDFIENRGSGDREFDKGSKDALDSPMGADANIVEFNAWRDERLW